MSALCLYSTISMAHFLDGLLKHLDVPGTEEGFAKWVAEREGSRIGLRLLFNHSKFLYENIWHI